MPDIIDEKGYLLGVVNVVDALVVLLLTALVVAGLGLALGGPSDTDQPAASTTVVEVNFQSEPVQPYVAEAVVEGPVPTANVSRLENRSVAASTVVTQSESGALSVQPHPTLRTVRFRVGLTVTHVDGAYRFEGAPVHIGAGLTLDVGETRITGNVTAIEPADS